MMTYSHLQFQVLEEILAEKDGPSPGPHSVNESASFRPKR